ncbi:response regulator transcription factor [Paenibacillus oleatilyticus]|uniref:response regulator transcription factor n=1 Tax=Paenibacillus oleatilyticus TaxID=2594886 RepID=UPI001C1FC271|nr:response regulator [Paenibacillus oleatilyticus]MBU7316594.1 response regulator [Paenibacillus oleatilyticus]
MYRLLIIDDEDVIVDGMADLFQEQTDMDLEVCRAYDVLEAIEWLEQTKIDVVLSDIQMPGLSGLQLQQRIMEYWPRCKVIFLTGYNEFAYIHEAMRNGSFDYVLKTETDEVILESVKKAIVKLDEEMEMQSALQKTTQLLQRALPYIQKEYLRDLLQGESYALGSMDRQFAQMSISLQPSNPVLLVVGRIDEWTENLNAFDRALILYAVHNISEELLGASTRVAFTDYERFRMVWLIQPKTDAEHGWEQTYRFVQGTLEQLQKTCRQLLKIKLSLISASRCCEWAELPARFIMIKRMFGYGLGLGEELLLTDQAYETEHGQLEQVKSPLQTYLWIDLKNDLESGRREAYFASFDAMTALLSASDEQTEKARTEWYYTLVAIYISILNYNSIRRMAAEQMDLDKLTKMQAHSHWSSAFDYLRELAEVIFAHRYEGQTSSENDVIARIKGYIGKNLHDDLSLTRLSDIVSLNPSYLSRLYKHHTGEALTETIKQARLQKSKELLRQPGVRINEISERVGFLSERSFYRFFKSMTNLTPQDYRELQK